MSLCSTSELSVALVLVRFKSHSKELACVACDSAPSESGEKMVSVKQRIWRTKRSGRSVWAHREPVPGICVT